MKTTKSAAFLITGLLIGAMFGPPAMAEDSGKQPMSMGGMAAADAPQVPPVTGYSEGEKIFFLHTETSDPKIAKVLTEMNSRAELPVDSGPWSGV